MKKDRQRLSIDVPIWFYKVMKHEAKVRNISMTRIVTRAIYRYLNQLPKDKIR